MIDFGDGHVARMARVDRLADLAAVVAELGLGRGRPVLVVVGGAAEVDTFARAAGAFTGRAIPASGTAVRSC